MDTRSLVSTSRVDVKRGDTIESRHRLHGAVADAAGDLVAWFGDPEYVSFFRSSAKPFQSLPLVDDGVVDAFGLTDEELAVCCASHSGEARHIELVQGLLDRVDLGHEMLACGPQTPFDKGAADALAKAGREGGRIHNNCSGKHAGMLLLAVHHGWSTDGYELPDHPVQCRMLDEVARWSGAPSDTIATAVDGCGVVCFALSMRHMATAYARFLADASAGGAARHIVHAMTAHPFAVAGSRRLCTDVMEWSSGDVWAKVGAEGVYGAGVVPSGLGLSLKAEDGAWRAGEVGLITLLDALGALKPDIRDRLMGTYGRVVNTREEHVGSIEGIVQLERVEAR